LLAKSNCFAKTLTLPFEKINWNHLLTFLFQIYLMKWLIINILCLPAVTRDNKDPGSRGTPIELLKYAGKM
jgi:hypothetical protein